MELYVRRAFWGCLVCIIIVGLAACSSGGGGSVVITQPEFSGPKVLLTGKIDGAGGSAMLNKTLTANANKVWAIPIAKMQGMNINPVNVFLRRSTNINPDGSFSFNLAQSVTLGEVKAIVPDIEGPEGMDDDARFDVDWLIVAMNNNEPLYVIQLAPGGDYDGMVVMPVSEYNETNINLDAIDRDNGIATLTVSAIENSVALSSDALKLLSRSDDILQSIKDIIKNCNIITNKCYEGKQSFVFMGNYGDLGAGSMADSYSGYQLYFNVNDYYNTSDFDNICSENPTVVYTLTPPGEITVNSVTYNQNNPLTTAGGGIARDRTGEMICEMTGGQNAFISKRGSGTNWVDWTLQFITGDTTSQLTTDMPDGLWSLKRNDIEIASFEFKNANPVDANGKPIVFIPKIRLLGPSGGEVAQGDAVNTVEIEWYRWDNFSNGYVQINNDDLSLLDSMAGAFEISISDFNGISDNNTQRYIHWWDRSFSNDTSVDVSVPSDGYGPFKYDINNEDDYNVDYIGVYYEFGGQGFRFAWRQSL